ncbi:DUF3789 domain-containing protein [Brevibacillus dissolubilis]|nr:DUF3789 domain-containing protein [Brevibacillus dissolubilis]
MFSFILGAMAGAILGVLTMSMLVASKQARAEDPIE